jgi:hypothetical protein
MKKFAVVRALDTWDRKMMDAEFWWETGIKKTTLQTGKIVLEWILN